MNTRNHFKFRFLRAVLMLTLAVMTFPIEAWAQTAYATLTDNGKTLTFKYDNDYDTYYPNSNEWDVSNTGSSTPGWYSNRKNITTVVFEDEFARANPKSCYQWFYGCENLTTITGLENLNTEEVVNMESMFKDCHSLTSLNVSSFNTEEVENMESMFEDCHSLTSLNVSSFNTGKVQNMKKMFRDCSRLTSLDLSSFKTREAQEKMDWMLYGCSSLANLTIGSDFTLDIDFTLGSGYTSDYLFFECTALANGMLIVKGTVEDNKLKPSIAEDIFKNVFINGTLVSNLTKEQLGITGTSSPYTWKGGSFTSFLPGRPYAKLSNDKKTLTFKCDKDKFTLGDNEWDVINTGTSEPGWSNYRGNITTVVFDASFADVRPKSCCKWFERCTNLSTIKGLRYLNTSEVTDMSYMFGYCSNLFSVTLPADVKSIDNGAFKDCSLLASITIPASVTKINKSAFEGCTSLATVYALPSTAPTLGDDVFKSVPTTCKYYVHGTGYDAWSIDDENKTIIWAATPGTKVTTATPVVSHGGKDYYTEGATVALGYSGEVPEGYSLVYTATKTSDNSDVTSTVISGSTLTMPAYDISVTATLKERTAYAVLSEDGKTLTFKCGVHTLAATNEWDVSDTGTSTPGWIKLDNIYSEITSVVFDESFADARPKSCNHWFYMCGKLTTITGLNYLNTSEVTDMAAMFCFCLKLTSLDLSSFNTSKVTDMTGMFQSCHNLTSLDLSSFNTSKVTKMFRMFQLCSNLTSIDLSSFDTREVTDMSEMFSSCISLKSLAIGSGFTVFNIFTTDIFKDCTALAEGMLIVNGTTPPTITKNIFSVFTNGTLATNLTKNDLGITETSSPYTWKGGKFKSVGKVKIPYIDENGKLHDDDGTKTPDDPTDDCADALPITSANNNVSYGAGWYFVAGDVTINGQLKFTGDAHIILCDGAKMTVTNTSSGAAIYGSDASLAIYGQSDSDGMGSLTATSSDNFSSIEAYSKKGNSIIINGGQVNATGGSGIWANSPGGNSSVIINGGQVTATGAGNGSGIWANSHGGNSSVTINGGQVNATGAGYGSGIEAYSPTTPSTNSGNSSVTINGGQVNATGGNNGCGIKAYSTDGDANITLSWTNPNDYIYANGYSLIGRTKNMKTATGKRFVAYNMASDDDISANCIIGDASSTTATAIGTDISLTDVTATKAIAGKTLKPLDGYTVSTTDNKISLKNGTTAKTPDFTITGTGTDAATISYYIYQSGDPVNMTLSNSATVPDGYTVGDIIMKDAESNNVSATETETAGVFSFNMPAKDVNIYGVKYYMTNVSYIGWDDTNKTYITDAKTPDGTKVWVLDGTEASLGTVNTETWYVSNTAPSTANENEGLFYSTSLLLQGEVHLILADGSAMTITRTSDKGLHSRGNGNITIYGQANGTGSLCATDEDYGISATNITINGGQVTATGGTIGKGISADGDITLGWSSPANFIKASSYSGTVKIAEGQYFTYEGNTGGLLSGTLSADQITAIAGKKLTPVVGHKVTVPARQYMTYFSPDALTLGTEQTDAALYTITGVGTDAVTLSDALTVASKETPLLVYNGATTEKDIFLYITAEPTTKTAHADEFKGTATAKEFSADDMKDKQCYVLAGGKMFVRVSGTGTIAAHRCWLELPNSNTNAARQLNIGNGDEPTGIDRMDNGQWIMDNYSGAWFSLDGRKLEGQPKRKGVYIHNGKKIAQSRRER